MKIEYSLDGNDYLNNYLFAASISDRIKKRRSQSRWAIPIIYTILALILLQQDKYVAFAIFMSLSILWAVFYPLYSRRYYMRHYKRVIAEQFQSTIDRIATVEIDSDHIIAKDSGSESKIAVSEIMEINEIPNLILLKLGPQSLIIPKYKIADADTVVKELKDLAAKLSIAYNERKDWKWK